MSSNPFVITPVRVVVYDPLKNKNLHTFCFLGDSPKQVQHAVVSYKTSSNKKLTTTVLREFYGSDFRSKLCLDIDNDDFHSSLLPQPANFGALEDADDAGRRSYEVKLKQGAFDDEIDLADLEELLEETQSEPRAEQNIRPVINTSTANTDLRADFPPGITYNTDISIYPEDKFSELKEKIYLATNIPAYRQHVFYISNNRYNTIYRLWADGLYNADIRKLGDTRDNIYGVPIDKMLYDIRDNVRVEAYDMFSILIDSMMLNNTIYVVDLAQFTKRIQTQMMDLIADTYQFELFYYGFIIKYWPQLTQECFHDYVLAETELQHKYPDLAKNKLLLASIYKAEKEIISTNYKSITKALNWAQHGNINIAITQMTATISAQRTVINIRNLFDRSTVSKCIPEIHAYVEHNNKKYLLRKRHIKNASDIQFPSGQLMKNGIVFAISLRKSDQDNYHTRSSISTMENEQSRYMFLNIWTNGKIYVRTIWNEEDEMNFNEIIRMIKKFTDPLITNINSMGRYVFLAGSELPTISKYNINYQSLSICVFWKKIMLENTFKILKTLWDPYFRAGITGVRNVQQFDKYEFLFRKGMYEYDTTAIERIITASNNIILNNYYAHLSNNSIKQKWDQNYDGRIVRMSHRTTDVRFEISGIHEQEFNLFYRYIVMFIYRSAHDSRIKDISATKDYKNTKKLRKLREQDPELFNLKKYGGKKLYSIRCQNKRQPLVYTDEETRHMSAAELKKLTKYWNFTLGKPAYYGCPNKNYPHLSFIVNLHPKHYCLPCCNKKPQSEVESKKSRINSVCLTKHKYELVNGTDMGVSRHIMGYGKDIDLGRLSKLPSASIKNLLYGTLENTKSNYYLYGVAQNVPAASNIGIVFAVAEALDISVEELILQLITELKKASKTNLFLTLMGGTIIEYFHNIDDLMLTIKELFIDNKLVSQEYQRFDDWAGFFVEVFHTLLHVDVVLFIDEIGDGSSVDMYVPEFIKNEISQINRLMSYDINMVDTVVGETKYVLAVKKSNNFYPIFVINTENYFKNLSIDRKHYFYHDEVMSLIYKMIAREDRLEALTVDKRIELGFIKEFCSDTKNATSMITKYINKTNKCYAVLVEFASQRIYVPVDYSSYVSDGIAISFEPFDRKQHNNSYSVLMKLMQNINKFIRTKYLVGDATDANIHSKHVVESLYTYRQLTIDYYVSVERVVIGFMTQDNLMFYFGDHSGEELDPTKQIREINYDYNEINKLILQRAPPRVDNRTTLLGESLYSNYLYNLFVIEFVNYLEHERNVDIRDKLKNLIKNTNFKKNIAEFNEEVRVLLHDYPEAYKLIQSRLIDFYYEHFNMKTLFEQIDNSVFEFDHLTLNRLKKMPREDMKRELKKISAEFSVEQDLDIAKIRFPNIYLPCGDLIEPTGYCNNKKLIVSNVGSGPGLHSGLDLDSIIDILSNDITDDLKSKYLVNNMWSETTYDFLRFTPGQNELINIYRLTE